MESRGTSSGSNKPGKVTKSVPRALSSGSIIECTERSSNRDRGLQRLLSPLTALERVSDFDNDFKSKNLRRPRPNLLNRPLATGRRCPEIHPRKRAVLCGVTYRNRKFRLKGTVNDVKSMRDLLINRFGYSQECIRVLTEEEGPAFCPTKKNIQEALKWLVEGSESGDSLVFYFSGHGLRQPDFNNDERDGFDETICPVDFVQEGMILDNDINSTIVRPLKKGVTLHAIVDACHSGIILDLEYTYNPKTSKWDDNSAPSKAQQSTSGGIAISLSACEDDQIMAADTSYFTGEAMAGAMTSALIQTLDRNKKLTYGSLLETIHETHEQINSGWFSSYYSGWCLNSKLLQKLFRYRIIQDPLLSSSEAFDVHKKEFVL
ncbi:metacaspase-1-like [Corylus avellana]|uniref:metacaspase-1-like n=1 Tax=Corylus avellana TaxID=13451 RepID=UPI00286AB18B|nr:metacaspase-1-like [Corylus avellana]